VDLEGVYTQIAEIGDVTGHSEGAAETIDDMRAAIAAVVADLPQPLQELTYYHELDDSYFSIGSDTFLGSIYGILGLTSIGDAAGGGYPQLSAEYIVSADPDFIFLADAICCGETPESVAARPGWGAMSAVTSGRVIPVDESLASRWSPRIVDYLTAVAAAVYGYLH
jgi:iron complex transport system substrate-binding protein